MNLERDQQIRALYQAALERPVAERGSFVAQLAGADQDLRQSVELMLSGQDATDAGKPRSAAAGNAPDLAVGTLLGTYRIDGVLGRGGMGVVYGGTDTKLHRPVAIKFLSTALADDEARRRFRQEAATASGLNHPHIVTVYDVGDDDGRQFIVSELVDGGTLEEWTAAKRHRTWRQSVELVTGVADALAAAHAAGVLHRDVKPSNILIGANGYAKLADFGLAKLIDSRTPGTKEREKNVRSTRAGVVLGTVAYMSPEQATGQPLDARSDVFSFGVMLYELLADRRPFESANELEVLKAIAHATPEPLPENIPDLLRMAVDKALEKDPADRYQTMQDFVADLRRVVRKPAGATSHAAPRSARLPWLVAAGLAVALVAALVPAIRYFSRAPAAAAPQIRFSLPAPGYAINGLAISPDGERIAYAAVTDGVRQIWLRPIGALEARPLGGTDNAMGVFWSPDGGQLAFTADGKIKKIDIAGGLAQAITDASPVPFAGYWASDGTILFTAPFVPNDQEGGVGLPIGRVAAAGGTVARLTKITLEEATGGARGHLIPRLLPDGDHFVFLGASPSGSTASLYVDSLRRPGPRLLLTLAVAGNRQVVPNVVYSDGFLLYARDGGLVAQSFDADELMLLGEPIVLADDVGEFSVAAGMLAYVERGAEPGDSIPTGRARRLVWFDRNGQRLGEVEAPAQYRLPVLAPDGRRIAMNAPDVAGPGVGFGEMWTVDTVRGVAARLTVDPAEDSAAVWSPDGSKIVFNSGRDGIPGLPSSLYERAANGAGADKRLFAGTADELIVPFDWSRDGRFILFGRAGATTWMNKLDLWVLPAVGEARAYAFVDSPFRKGSAKFSPDGRWVVYSTYESGRSQVVVQPFPDASRGRWVISPRGGLDPRWRDDGREIVYLDPDGMLIAVDVQPDGDEFESGSPRPLFSTGLAMQSPDEAPEYLYDMTGDGQRFLINEFAPVASAAPVGAEEPAIPPTLKVIVNWSAGLARP